MYLLQYLIPILILSPFALKGLSRNDTQKGLLPLFLTVPLTLIGLSIYSYITQNSVELNLWSYSDTFSFGLKVDVLAGLIGATVSTIGLVVYRFSLRYLEDDANKESFFKNLMRTLSSVLFMLMTNNLVLFFIGWGLTSYFLHQLLTHFSQRQGAVKAANHKKWFGYIGDILIVVAAVLFFATFRTLEFQSMAFLLEDFGIHEQFSLMANIASFLIVIGAMAKSAQYPFHGWLPNTMEAPTPVSAIMHAGIINAGGYLIIRMSPVLASTPMALAFLAIVGSFTAFWATIVMFTQSNIKKNLAYSTIAQMGFMMVQCGLGAFSIAVVHIIGHAFYKAYAFLSSGTATDFGRLNRYFPKTKVRQSFWSSLSLGVLSISLVLVGLTFSGFSAWEKPSTYVLLIVLALASAQIILNSNDKLRALSFASIMVFIYFSLSTLMSSLLKEIIPAGEALYGDLGLITLAITTSFFLGLYLIQNNLDKLSQTKIGKQIYVKALRGGF